MEQIWWCPLINAINKNHHMVIHKWSLSPSHKKQVQSSLWYVFILFIFSS